MPSEAADPIERWTAHISAIAQGNDPAQMRQDRLREPTFGDLAEQYLERHAPRKSLKPRVTCRHRRMRICSSTP